MSLPSNYDMKGFLDERVEQYNQPNFIETDPIFVPHQFTKKEDIEIAAFLTATIAWGQRPVILKNALHLLELMGNSPHEFILHHRDSDLKRFLSFKHRTFNADDCLFFLYSLRNLYQNGGLEKAFTGSTAFEAIVNFRKIFFTPDYPHRTQKHVSNPVKGASAKRLNMFLRWMVRKDQNGVDFGLWNNLKPQQLMCPLDVHSGSVGRKLGLLTRKQNDWKAVDELTQNLRELDAQDPVKYDFALFGLGVFEKF